MWFRDGAGWRVFDETGEEIEEGQLDALGNPVHVVRTMYSADHQSRREMTWQDGSTNTFELNSGPFGPIETRIFVNGHMTSRNVIAYDEKGRESVAKYFDGEGKMTGHAAYRYDKGLKESFTWDANGAVTHHSLSRYDGDGDEMERTDYDPQGKPFANFRVNKVELLSYWVDPECKCASGAAYGLPGDQTVYYLIDKDGQFTKSVEHHRGRRTNQEPDDAEAYDAAGRLMDRVTYTYERDVHGNWTRRIISVLDPISRTMVSVREDTRVLTYY